jgi:hypothetical protein
MGAMDTRNMYNDFAVNKYLHTVASCWILLIYSVTMHGTVDIKKKKLVKCNCIWTEGSTQPTQTSVIYDAAGPVIFHSIFKNCLLPKIRFNNANLISASVLKLVEYWKLYIPLYSVWAAPLSDGGWYFLGVECTRGRLEVSREFYLRNLKGNRTLNDLVYEGVSWLDLAQEAIWSIGSIIWKL